MRVASPLLLLALVLIGCTTPRTVQVVIRNDADRPVYAWLTKDGPPVEDRWFSPGQLAAYYPPGDEDESLESLPGFTIPPGKAFQLPDLRGKFPRGTNPILRIFNGPETLDQLAAVPKRSPAVDTVLLAPGGNYVIIERASPVAARRVSPEQFNARPPTAPELR